MAALTNHHLKLHKVVSHFCRSEALAALCPLTPSGSICFGACCTSRAACVPWVQPASVFKAGSGQAGRLTWCVFTLTILPSSSALTYSREYSQYCLCLKVNFSSSSSLPSNISAGLWDSDIDIPGDPGTELCLPQQFGQFCLLSNTYECLLYTGPLGL